MWEVLRLSLNVWTIHSTLLSVYTWRASLPGLVFVQSFSAAASLPQRGHPSPALNTAGGGKLSAIVLRQDCCIVFFPFPGKHLQGCQPFLPRRIRFLDLCLLYSSLKELRPGKTRCLEQMCLMWKALSESGLLLLTYSLLSPGFWLYCLPGAVLGPDGQRGKQSRGAHLMGTQMGRWCGSGWGLHREAVRTHGPGQVQRRHVAWSGKVRKGLLLLERTIKLSLAEWHWISLWSNILKVRKLRWSRAGTGTCIG